MDLKVNNIFYSIQGEGLHSGEASIFIRLAGCNENCLYCDTDWLHGTDMSIEQITERLPSAVCKTIVWTGGEPTLQLTDKVLMYFKNLGYKQSIETNGTNKLPHGLDYVACSPKVLNGILANNFAAFEINEFRCLIGRDLNGIRCFPPAIETLPKAHNYFVSPLFVGEAHKKFELDRFNLDMAIQWVKDDPRWKLSIQQHKLWGIE